MESKATSTDRLRGERRWDEASAFKDETIANCRRKGMKRLDAQDAGWAAMLEKYPPLATSSENEELAAYDPATNNLPDSTPSSFLADAFWVYNQLGKGSVTAAEAPSSGSWALLRWAKRNEDRFFEQIMPKALTLSTKIEAVEPEVNVHLQHLQTLEEMLGWKSPTEKHALV